MKIWAGRVFGRVAGLDEETHGERSATSLLLSCTSSQFYWVFSYSLKKSKSNLFWHLNYLIHLTLTCSKILTWLRLAPCQAGQIPDPMGMAQMHTGTPWPSDITMKRRCHQIWHTKTCEDKVRQTTKRFKMVQGRKMEDARKFCKTAKSIFGACKPELKTLGSCFWNSSSWAWWQIMRTKFPRLQIVSCMYLLPFHYHY